MRGCRSSEYFLDISSLALHWDSGKCCEGRVDREQMDRYLIKHDRDGRITNTRRTITDGTGMNSYLPPPSYEAAALAWNGRAYACYFCPTTFRTLRELNAHLASPKHSRGTLNGGSVYHCTDVGRCNMQFGALSAVVQHIKHGRCGALRMSETQDLMETLTNGMRRLTF